MSTSAASDPVLDRGALVAAALALLDELGPAGLSMRALADRLGVKAASLYWHVRDKDQLLDLIATTVLDSADVPASVAGWRAQVAAGCQALAARLDGHPAAAAVILDRLPASARSRFARDLARTLAAAGLANAEHVAVSLVLEVAAEGRLQAVVPATVPPGEEMLLAIDSGSWRAHVRAGPVEQAEAVAFEGGGPTPSPDSHDRHRIVVRGVGGRHAAVLLNPAYDWRIKVHSGSWKTMLELGGLRVLGVDFDSGSGNITCTLPRPVGVVPVRVNSGIAGMTMHRPSRTPLHATVAQGSTRVRLDGTGIRVSARELQWHSQGALDAADRYELTVHSGCVKVTMDDDAPEVPMPRRAPDPPPPPPSRGGTSLSGVALLLDGIEQRLTHA